MVWNILFFVLGVFGGVTLMALVQVADWIKEDEENVELRRKARELARREEKLKEKALDIIMNIPDEVLNEHVPKDD